MPIPFSPHPLPTSMPWGAQLQPSPSPDVAGQVGWGCRRRGKAAWIRASTDGAGAQHSRSRPGRVPRIPKTTPTPSSLSFEVPPAHPKSEQRLPWADATPQAQLAANCVMGPSQTHRGPHRRGVAAGRWRAAHCDQGHGVRRGRLGGHWAGPPPTAPGLSLPRRTRKERGAARAWHLLGGGP